MKIAVTAASGRLGFALLRRLSTQIGTGQVVAVARDPSRVLVPGIEKRAGDYQSEDGMRAALKGIDTAVSTVWRARKRMGPAYRSQPLHREQFLNILRSPARMMRELLAKFNEANHSRLPVYRETLDDVAGMIHVKDFMRWMSGRGAKPKAKAKNPGITISAKDLALPVKQSGIYREVLFVPPSMPAADLLLKMQATHIHMGIVIDEYGGSDGLISIEDLVEEIVGDISDEHDTDDEQLKAWNVECAEVDVLCRRVFRRNAIELRRLECRDELFGERGGLTLLGNHGRHLKNGKQKPQQTSARSCLHGCLLSETPSLVMATDFRSVLSQTDARSTRNPFAAGARDVAGDAAQEVAGALLRAHAAEPVRAALDDDAVGDGESAMDALGEGDKPAPAHFVVQRRRAQVDHHIERAAIDDGVIRAAHGLDEIRDRRGEGGHAVTVLDLVQREVQFVCLVQGNFENARSDLHRAGETGRWSVEDC